jgi:hypothetical protein
LWYFIFMIEKYIITEGPDKGRVKDVDIAMDLACTEDAWREETTGEPMLSAPPRLGKPEVHYRDIVNEELKRLILKSVATELDKELGSVYPAELKESDPESSNEAWMTYRLANRLLSAGEEHGIDFRTCEELLLLDFPDAFEAAYGYLTQAELDADTILAEFIES